MKCNKTQPQDYPRIVRHCRRKHDHKGPHAWWSNKPRSWRSWNIAIEEWETRFKEPFRKRGLGQ